MTPQEWLDRFGPCQDPALCAAPSPASSLSETHQQANALCDWFTSHGLTQGEGMAVMAHLIGRMLAVKIHENLLAGTAAAETTFNLVTICIQDELNRLGREKSDDHN